jgi:hypothetical protein
LSCRTKWGQERSYYYLYESNPQIPDIEFEHPGKEEETSLEAIQARMTKTTLLLTSFATVLVFLEEREAKERSQVYVYNAPVSLLNKKRENEEYAISQPPALKSLITL